jgi:sulfur-carrier protein adenylyltransferase/sulfurtransferase
MLSGRDIPWNVPACYITMSGVSLPDQLTLFMESGLLTPRELRRYSKQIIIPEIGQEGQIRLKNAKVLVVGAGGLGCPVLQYLAAAGTGKIGIVEFETVGESDLQSQVLYGSLDVGKLKVIIAKNWLERLNKMIEIEVFNLRLDESNAIGTISQYDLVVNATNNRKAGFIINDSCVILNKPMVHGAIFKAEGQVSVFNFNAGPTFRCFNTGERADNDKSATPGDAGHLGVLSGITGTLMANEVLKILTGIGSVLSGNLLIFNIIDNSFRTIAIQNVTENHNISKLEKE